MIPDLAGDTSLALNGPLPATVTISGTVKDGKGPAVADAGVRVRSQSVTGAPGVEFSSVATTDENGEYHISVPAGIYRLLFTPRTPPPP